MSNESTNINVNAKTFSVSRKKLHDVQNATYDEMRRYEREIDVHLQYIDHLEALLAKTEDERDHYRHILEGCI